MTVNVKQNLINLIPFPARHCWIFFLSAHSMRMNKTLLQRDETRKGDFENYKWMKSTLDENVHIYLSFRTWHFFFCGRFISTTLYRGFIILFKTSIIRTWTCWYSENILNRIFDSREKTEWEELESGSSVESLAFFNFVSHLNW